MKHRKIARKFGYTRPELRSRRREARDFILRNNPDLFSKRGLRDFKVNFKDEKVGDLLEFYSEDIEIVLLKPIYDMVVCHIMEQRNKCKQGMKQKKRIPYSDYLKSKLWLKVIRPRVLHRDNHQCQICESEKYLQVHHRSYAKAVMNGNDDSQLITLCKSHHSHIEFIDGNKKRRRKEVEKLLGGLLTEEQHGNKIAHAKNYG